MQFIGAEIQGKYLRNMLQNQVISGGAGTCNVGKSRKKNIINIILNFKYEKNPAIFSFS
jgi:hypothetical protein